MQVAPASPPGAVDGPAVRRKSAFSFLRRASSTQPPNTTAASTATTSARRGGTATQAISYGQDGKPLGVHERERDEPVAQQRKQPTAVGSSSASLAAKPNVGALAAARAPAALFDAPACAPTAVRGPLPLQSESGSPRKSVPVSVACSEAALDAVLAQLEERWPQLGRGEDDASGRIRPPPPAPIRHAPPPPPPHAPPPPLPQALQQAAAQADSDAAAAWSQLRAQAQAQAQLQEQLQQQQTQQAAMAGQQAAVARQQEQTGAQQERAQAQIKLLLQQLAAAGAPIGGDGQGAQPTAWGELTSACG